MPVYQYTGKSRTGAAVSGQRNAANKTQLAALLRREQITPTAIKEKGKEFAVPKVAKGGVSSKELAIFFAPVLGDD